MTVAAIRQPIALADQFGVIETAERPPRVISAFREKPTDAVGLADAPDQVYASMGNYVFTTDALLDALRQDALDPTSKHDMGGNIIPMLVEQGEAQVYDFRRQRRARARPTATAATGATWGRSTRSTTPTWT